MFFSYLHVLTVIDGAKIEIFSIGNKFPQENISDATANNLQITVYQANKEMLNISFAKSDLKTISTTHGKVIGIGSKTKPTIILGIEKTSSSQLQIDIKMFMGRKPDIRTYTYF